VVAATRTDPRPDVQRQLLAGGDGIRSDDTDPGRGRVTVTNGTVRVNAGDDAVKGENTVDISGGTVTVTSSYEAIESRQMTISGGTVDVTARDDAINGAVHFTGGTIPRQVPGPNTPTSGLILLWR